MSESNSNLETIIKVIELLDSTDFIKLKNFIELYSYIRKAGAFRSIPSSGRNLDLRTDCNQGTIVLEQDRTRQVYYEKTPSKRKVYHGLGYTGVRKIKYFSSDSDKWSESYYNKKRSKKYQKNRPKNTLHSNPLECSLEETIYKTVSISEIIASEIQDWKDNHGEKECPAKIKKQIRERVLNTRNKYL